MTNYALKRVNSFSWMLSNPPLLKTATTSFGRSIGTIRSTIASAFCSKQTAIGDGHYLSALAIFFGSVPSGDLRVKLHRPTLARRAAVEMRRVVLGAVRRSKPISRSMRNFQVYAMPSDDDQNRRSLSRLALLRGLLVAARSRQNSSTHCRFSPLAHHKTALPSPPSQRCAH